MSTFDIEEPEELWPLGIQDNTEEVKRDILEYTKTSIVDTKGLNTRLNKLTIEMRSLSPSVEFLHSVISMQSAPTKIMRKNEKNRESERITSNLENLEEIVKRLLDAIVRDTYETSTGPEIEELQQELLQLFGSMIETYTEGPVSHKYSPKLEAVLSRIAVTGLVTLDQSNNSIDFDF